MEIKLEIPSYDEEKGLEYYWEYGFEIAVNESKGRILISANKAGLVSLAVHLLTLAQDAVPLGSHHHFDDYNSLRNGSKELVIEKIDMIDR